MSWSIGAAGKASVVAVEIERQFTSMTYPCPEPEESAKQAIRIAINTLLTGHTKEGTIVRVSANGSQSYRSVREGDKDIPKDVYNSLNVTVETIAILE